MSEFSEELSGASLVRSLVELLVEFEFEFELSELS